MNGVVIGLSWGDEGKGKIVDMIRDDFNIVVRYSGGDNAGHTVVRDGIVYKFHILPSSILSPHVISVIGPGTVINPYVLVDEYLNLPKNHGKLFISGRAHIVLDFYRKLDELIENIRFHKIGTTRRGIGPAYAMKMYRLGIRVEDFVIPEKLKEHYREIQEFAKLWDIDISDDLKELLSLANFIRPMVIDTAEFLWTNRDKNILFEGAQGYMLDIDMGTYPYVTSSHPGIAGVVAGGFPPSLIHRRIGVLKAYSTRVGEGMFPTELTDEIGIKIRNKGNEFGATTGRPRRCGWLDLVQARFAIFMNDINEIALMKLDVLTGISEVKVAIKYRIGERVIDFWNYNVLSSDIVPIYETFEGWEQDIFGVTKFEDLPKQARIYVEFIEDFLTTKIKYISTGPSPEYTIHR